MAKLLAGSTVGGLPIANTSQATGRNYVLYGGPEKNGNEIDDYLSYDVSPDLYSLVTKPVTVSFEIKSNAPAVVPAFIVGVSKEIPTTTVWVAHTFTIPSLESPDSVEFATIDVAVRGLKIEAGTVATPWSPAYEEVPEHLHDGMYEEIVPTTHITTAGLSLHFPNLQEYRTVRLELGDMTHSVATDISIRLNHENTSSGYLGSRMSGSTISPYTNGLAVTQVIGVGTYYNAVFDITEATANGLVTLTGAIGIGNVTTTVPTVAAFFNGMNRGQSLGSIHVLLTASTAMFLSGKYRLTGVRK